MAVKIITLSDGTDDLYPVTSAELVAGLPQISNDISTDAASTTKVTSPKAVKDYVDAHGGSSATTYQLGDELYFRIAAPASTNDRCVLQVITHYVGTDYDQISHGTPITHLIELGFTEEPMHYFYMFGIRGASAFGNNILYSYNDTTYEHIAYYLPTLGANSYAEVTVLSGTAPSISVVNSPVSGETVDWDNPLDWVAMRGGVTSIYYWSSGLRVNYSNGTYEYIYSATLGQGYCTNNQSASTTARTVTIANYERNTGGIVAVRFTNAVPANATLNINSKGASNIYYRGSRLVANVIEAGDTATFMYDGSSYQLISIDKSGSSVTISTNLITDKTSTTKAIAPKPVYDAVYPAKTTPSSSSFAPSWNTAYDLGTMTESYYSFSFSAPSDSSIVNWCYITFTTGSTRPTISWMESGITLTWQGGSYPTINANKTYEIIIINGLGVCIEY